MRVTTIIITGIQTGPTPEIEQEKPLALRIKDLKELHELKMGVDSSNNSLW